MAASVGSHFATACWTPLLLGRRVSAVSLSRPNSAATRQSMSAALAHSCSSRMTPANPGRPCHCDNFVEGKRGNVYSFPRPPVYTFRAIMPPLSLRSLHIRFLRFAFHHFYNSFAWTYDAV